MKTPYSREELAFLRAYDDALKAGDFEALRTLFAGEPEFPNIRLTRPGLTGHLLQDAIYQAPLALIRRLLELGADPNYDEFDGFPSIIAALSCKPSEATPGRDDQPAIVQALIEHGADIDQRGLNDFTPLHWAAADGDEDIVRLLLAAGADPTLRTRIDELETPAEVARTAGHEGLAKWLEEAERERQGKA